MPSYMADWRESAVVKVSRKQVFFLCIFRLPDHVKERIPASIAPSLEGKKLMGFYCDPLAGDRIIYDGIEWEVMRRIHKPTRRSTRQQKYISEVELKFIGEVESTEIPASDE